MSYNFALERLNETHICNIVEPKVAEAFIESSVTLLQKKGFRITSPRFQVLRALAETNATLAPQKIQAAATAAGGRIDLVSVYRTLQTFMEAGIVHHIGITDGYYACRTDHSQSEHTEYLVCSKCGCVSEHSVPEAASEDLKSRASVNGFEVNDIHIEILGLCQHCRAA